MQLEDEGDEEVSSSTTPSKTRGGVILLGPASPIPTIAMSGGPLLPPPPVLSAASSSDIAEVDLDFWDLDLNGQNAMNMAPNAMLSLAPASFVPRRCSSSSGSSVGSRRQRRIRRTSSSDTSNESISGSQAIPVAEHLFRLLVLIPASSGSRHTNRIGRTILDNITNTIVTENKQTFGSFSTFLMQKPITGKT
ncbi:hypothetical protein J437_LFUL006408 [Ladona fulva]|uniref:Uncharacterized protein n=1 Tax=Ladona fulva TaxID=123851 RepID=A0A8K0K596_LADFU|nr:hypothetical protein J437_LFUL006408 [Ladona fulva]